MPTVHGRLQHSCPQIGDAVDFSAAGTVTNNTFEGERISTPEVFYTPKPIQSKVINVTPIP
jgi:hypothetical protein